MHTSKRLLRWVEHKTNPAHVLCRFMTLLKIYDKFWRFVFVHDPTPSQKSVVDLILQEWDMMSVKTNPQGKVCSNANHN